MEIVDESEVIEGDDVVGYRLKRAKKLFDELDKEDFVTITIHRPPEPETLVDILRGLKKEFSVKGMNNRCTEHVLTELGYRTCYKYLARSGFLDIQKITKRIKDTIGSRLIDGYPEMANFVLSQRDNTVNIYLHVSEQQHKQLKEVAFDLYIPIGDVLLMCLTCAFNDLEERFDTCGKMDIKYEKYCSTNGFLSVIMNHTNEIVNKARLYIINSRPTLELGIKEKESVISSGLPVPSNYMKKLGAEKKLLRDIDKFIGNYHNTVGCVDLL
jgi:hypothetical protein